MTIEPTAAATEAQWRTAQARRRKMGTISALIGVLFAPALTAAAIGLAHVATDGEARFPATVAFSFLLCLPVVVLITRANNAEQDKSDQVVESVTQQLAGAVQVAAVEAGERKVQARRQEFESRLANALDMAEGEPEVIEVIERSFTSTAAQNAVELLLADNSHAHLLRMASVTPGEPTSGCGVDSPDHCPAARRAQVQRFADSEDLDACPKLRGRVEGNVSAVCVPVSIMGRTVGVIHATGAPREQLGDDKVHDLETLAKLAGARVGLLRVMAETQLQASTDSLTGLLNRRSFETRLALARRDDAPLAVAMADLDHFKTLNDTFGHETGDRALRMFAQVLQGSLREQDLVCRHGGEEFVLALIGCSVDSARTILDTLRDRLEAAITVAGLPAFTVSFGLVQARHDEELPTLTARADAALFQAKRDGRDRVVVHDDQGTARPPTPVRTLAPRPDPTTLTGPAIAG